MKTSIKIVSGKRGWHLKVNGLFISQGFKPDPIKAIIGDFGIPYGATEWVSVQAIKDFWHKYMPLILLATCHPCNSVWGRIAYIPESADPEIGHAEYLEASGQMKSFDIK